MMGFLLTIISSCLTGALSLIVGFAAIMCLSVAGVACARLTLSLIRSVTRSSSPLLVIEITEKSRGKQVVRFRLVV